MTQPEHISVCICTYRRPELLRELLAALAGQNTNALFTYSIVVVDNDAHASARAVVDEFSQLPIRYCIEPQQNISRARNRAVAEAKGEYIAFIDDDEVPIKDWLRILYEECNRRNVDGVLGPVKPQFQQEPPAWVVKGRFYDRPSYPTGLIIDWRKGRTGNVLLRYRLFEGLREPFKPEFLTGEDQDFFRRMIDKGHVFVWCHEALAHEWVPPIRWNRSFMLRRALLRGKISIRHPGAKQSMLKSLLAVPLYTLSLPVMCLFGQHWMMKYLIKLCDHAGRLLAVVGLNPVRDAYVTE